MRESRAAARSQSSSTTHSGSGRKKHGKAKNGGRADAIWNQWLALLNQHLACSLVSSAFLCNTVNDIKCLALPDCVASQSECSSSLIVSHWIVERHVDLGVQVKHKSSAFIYHGL